WIQRISEPRGILVGAIYPDPTIDNVVSHIHEQPNLMQSATFRELYGKFLLVQKKLLEKYGDGFSSESVEILEQELSGTFKLPTRTASTSRTNPVPVPIVQT